MLLSFGTIAKANLQTMAEEFRRLENERMRKKATDSFINKAMINMMQLPLNITVDRTVFGISIRYMYLLSLYLSWHFCEQPYFYRKLEALA